MMADSTTYLSKEMEKRGGSTNINYRSITPILRTSYSHPYKQIVTSISDLRDPEDPEADDVYLEEIPPWTIREILVTIAAIGAVVCSIITLILPPNPVTTIASVVGIAIPSYSALQEQKITDCKAMKESNEAMDRELNNLKYENERLQIENKRLDTSINRLKDVGETLIHIRQLEDSSLTTLETQLFESRNILSKMNSNYLATVIDTIFDIIIASNDDGDFELSDEEIQELIYKIEGIEGVEIDDELCRKAIILRGRNIDAVFDLVRDLLDGDPNTGLGPEFSGSKIFTVKD